MCNNYSESGQPCGFEPCEAYKRLEAENAELQKKLCEPEGKCAYCVGEEVTYERGRVESLEAENAALRNTIDILKMERGSEDKGKEALYDVLFPGENEEEKEVRWKWMIARVKALRQERDCLLDLAEYVASDALFGQLTRLFGSGQKELVELREKLQEARHG